MGIIERIKEIEAEMARTQKNKATEYHLGQLKAKIAKLRTQLLEPPKGSSGAGERFEVTKFGHGRVALIGFPSPWSYHNAGSWPTLLWQTIAGRLLCDTYLCCRDLLILLQLEYNICFTTVERSSDDQSPNLPTSNVVGVLPTIIFLSIAICHVMLKRRMVKSWMKTASGLKVQQFDIQQQALKLTANSMYGCLGFSNSRFYAKPLAELITLQGREILQSTVELVQNKLNLKVKNFVLLGDILKSIYFLSWKEQGAQLSLLAKDFGSLDCYATEFLIDGGTLSLVVSDDQKNIQFAE